MVPGLTQRRRGMYECRMRVLLLVAMGLGAMGCGDDAGMTTPDGGGGRPDTGGGGSGLCAVDSPDGANLTGQFAVRVDLDVTMTERGDALIALCPSPQMAQAALLFKWDNTGGGGSIESMIDVCD